MALSALATAELIPLANLTNEEYRTCDLAPYVLEMTPQLVESYVIPVLGLNAEREAKRTNADGSPKENGLHLTEEQKVELVHTTFVELLPRVIQLRDRHWEDEPGSRIRRIHGYIREIAGRRIRTMFFTQIASVSNFGHSIDDNEFGYAQTTMDVDEDIYADSIERSLEGYSPEEISHNPTWAMDPSCAEDLFIYTKLELAKRHEMCERVRHLITPFQQTILRMRVVQRMNADEIGEILNKTRNNIYYHLSKITEKVQQSADDLGI